MVSRVMCIIVGLAELHSQEEESLVTPLDKELR